MPDVTLPKLADTLVEGTVSRWLKRPGERVTKGEPLVEVETDKVNSELESPYEGVLTEIVAAEGTTVPVGDVIARIEAGDSGVQSEPEPATEDAPRPGLTEMTGLRRRSPRPVRPFESGAGSSRKNPTTATTERAGSASRGRRAITAARRPASSVRAAAVGISEGPPERAIGLDQARHLIMRV